MERNTRPGVPLCAAAIRVHASGRVRQQPRGLARCRPEETPEHGSGRLVCLSLLRGEGEQRLGQGQGVLLQLIAGGALVPVAGQKVGLGAARGVCQLGQHPAQLLQIQGGQVGKQVTAAAAQPLGNGLGQAALALQGERLPNRRHLELRQLLRSLLPEFFIVIRLTSDFLLLYAKIYMNMWKMVDRQILIYLLVQLPLMGRYFPVQNFRNICRIF